MSNLPLLAFQHHVGQLFIDPGEIEFVCSLGDGELALVEKGRWRTQNGVLPVVVKGYKPFVVGSPQDFRELLLEASKLHRLQHKNITRFLGLGCFSHGTLAEVRESMFMVEEYVGTRTLRKVISEQMRCRVKNLYDMRTALRWAAEIAAALAALHEQQPAYIHGDVKADNAFLTDCENVSHAVAKLGDLKPHRHAYDREPSTLSHHQQNIAPVQSRRQSSLELYTLERSSMGSSNSRHSKSTGCASGTYPDQTPWADSLLQQQALCDIVTEPLNTAAAAHESQHIASKPLQDSNTAAVKAFAGTAAQGHSTPVPIRSNKAEGVFNVGSCPADWDHSTLFSSCTVGKASGWNAAVRSSSLPEELGNMVAIRMARSLPITSCLSASEMSEAMATVATPTEGLGVKASSPAAIKDQHKASDVCVELLSSSNGGSWCPNSNTTLSDSASSTQGGSNKQGAGKGPVGLISLANAEDEDESLYPLDHELLQHVAAAGSQSSTHQPKPAASKAAVPADSIEPEAAEMQHDSQCQVHAGSRPRSKSDLSSRLQQQKEQQLAKLPLETSKSAPESLCRGALEDHAVHRGAFMKNGLLGLLAAGQQTPRQDARKGQQSDVQRPIQQQQPSVGATAFVQQRSSPSGQRILGSASKAECKLPAGKPADTNAAKKLKGSQTRAPLSWELSPTGAASPCGAVHTTMLDLFADYAEDDEPSISRRTRDQYSLAPGSLLQQRVSTSSYATTACQAQAVKSSASWSQSASTVNGSRSSSFLAPALQQQQLQQQQNGHERPCISKIGAPTAIESKQHGSNSAYAALTAIDCITEETSSVATDSVMGSFPPSRESTAHGGVRFFADAPLSAAGSRDQEIAGNGVMGPSHLIRGLNVNMLLSARTSSGSMGLVSFGSGEGVSIYDGAPAPVSAVLPIDHIDSNSADAGLQQQLSVPQAPQQNGAADAGNEALTNSVDSATDVPADPAAAAAAAAAGGAVSPKKVRFDMSRPAGSTPSRDYGLLYTAPELLSGQRPTEKVDVFAFGVMLHELLSRSLLFPHCAAAVAQNRSHRGSSRHGGSRHHRDKASNSSPLETKDSTVSDDSDTLPEQKILLSYAQLVAGGYRPPFPDHFPECVQRLISSCWAAEPHERPRMTEVLQQLQEIARDTDVVLQLDRHLAGLADMGYCATGPDCSCGCVIS